jgi:hypothetical protein
MAVELAKAGRQTTSLEIEVDITLFSDIISSLLLVVNLRYLPKGLVRSESNNILLMMEPPYSLFGVAEGAVAEGAMHTKSTLTMTADCRAVTAARVLTSLQGNINSNDGGM